MLWRNINETYAFSFKWFILISYICRQKQNIKENGALSISIQRFLYVISMIQQKKEHFVLRWFICKKRENTQKEKKSGREKRGAIYCWALNNTFHFTNFGISK